MRQQFKQFLLRWVVCSLGLWIASLLFTTIAIKGDKFSALVFGGLILAIVNTVLKPLVTVLSLPAIMLSLGLFTVIINGFMVVIAGWVYGPIDVETFGAAILTGVIIGLLNFIITRALERKGDRGHAKRI